MHDETAAQHPQILVFSRSRINLVVIADIVKRSGLRCEHALLAEAPRLLKSRRPKLMIIDGGPDNRDCDDLLESIAELKRVSDGESPTVLLLSNRVGTPESLGLPPVVDEVVAKPITLEAFQPVLSRAMQQAF